MIQPFPSIVANTVSHFECYLFNYSPTNCRSERRLSTYFEFVSDNFGTSWFDTFFQHLMMIPVHPMNLFLPVIWMLEILLLLLILMMIRSTFNIFVSVGIFSSRDPIFIFERSNYYSDNNDYATSIVMLLRLCRPILLIGCWLW